jgi:stage II sporulation protein P
MAALIQRQFVWLSFVTAFLFILTGVMAMSGNRFMLTSSTIQQASSNISSVALLTVMSHEIPALAEKVQAPSDRAAGGFTGYVFQLVTGVDPGDLRSVIGSQLPGLLTFDDAGYGFIGQREQLPELTIEYPSSPAAVAEVPPPAGEAGKEGDKPRTGETAAPATVQPKDQAKPSTNGKNVVFIYHTHNRESWLSVTEREGRSVDHKTTNITLVGRHLTEALKERGIGTEVNTDDFYQRLLDSGKSFPLAYAESLKAVHAAAQQNRELHYFFDIHRDDRPRDETTAAINGKNYARITFVIGMGNKNYKQNAKFANELQKLLEQKYPGITRPLTPKNEKTGQHGEYNQSISPGSLLLEIGGTENTLQECYNTAEAFADAFAEYYWQAERASAEQSEKPDKR